MRADAIINCSRAEAFMVAASLLYCSASALARGPAPSPCLFKLLKLATGQCDGRGISNRLAPEGSVTTVQGRQRPCRNPLYSNPDPLPLPTSPLSLRTYR